LEAKELLVVEAGSWSFRSDLVREVAYGTITKADRARAHAGIAKYIETKENHLHDAVLDQIAHHYARAAELVLDIGVVDGVPKDITERALHWLEKAAARAEQTEAPAVAARLHGEGLNLAGSTPSPLRRLFLLGRARSLAEVREMAQARADVTAALAEAEQEGDRKDQACSLLVLADVEQKESRHDVADVLLTQAAELFDELDDDAGRAETLRLRGFGALFRNDFDAAYASLDAALELFRDLGDRRGEGWALQNLSWCAFMTGQVDEAEARLRQSAATFADIGDLGGLGWAMGLLAWTRLQQGFADEAEAMGEQVLSEACERGDRWAEGMMEVLIACIRCWSGRTLTAIDRARHALDLFNAIDDEYGRMQALAPLGRSLVTAGFIDEGFVELEALRGRVTPLMAPRSQAFFLTPMLGAAVQIGDVELGASVWATMPGDGDWEDPEALGHGEGRVTLALHALQRGQVERAISVLETGGLNPADGYAQSSLALAFAAAGRGDDAVARAGDVLANPRSTYLDRTFAGIALGLTSARSGDADGADAALVVARELVDSTEDRVGQAIVRVAGAVAADALGANDFEARADEAEAALDQLGIEARGWRVAFGLAASSKTTSGAR
jgi:tetratricopeptide (TPR) repeat protein